MRAASGLLGFDVFAGVRRRRTATSWAPRLGTARARSIDVTDADSIAHRCGDGFSRVGDGGLAGLVNNAGIAVAAPLEFIPIDELRRQLEVNVIGQVAVTQAFLPLLRKGQGRIVNIGSIGGRVALPMVGPYAASKFAMEAITDSLRRELRASASRCPSSSPAGSPRRSGTAVWPPPTRCGHTCRQRASDLWQRPRSGA